MVDLRADVAVVDLAYAVHGLLGEGWHLGSGEVVLDLLRASGAGDSAGDRRVHQDPAQSELRQGAPPGHQLSELLRGLEPGLEVHAREGLAPIKGLPLA